MPIESIKVDGQEWLRKEPPIVSNEHPDVIRELRSLLSVLYGWRMGDLSSPPNQLQDGRYGQTAHLYNKSDKTDTGKIVEIISSD